MSAPSRPMRRRDREVGAAEAWAILARADWGVLATVDAEGWPYAVPVNHVVVDGAVFIHCATAGHKLDNLAAESPVSYCAVEASEVLPEELSTRYRSAILFGRARRIEDEAGKRAALLALGRRFAPEHLEQVEQETEKDLFRTLLLRIDVERITGKVRA